ncbi:MAG: hypothetical protein WBB23_17415 [Desulforhopalus sp.]
MNIAIEQSCPSCGASIVISEDDRLIQCSFCDVYNYRIGTTGSRYVLPSLLSNQVDANRLIYVPYLRFKGSIFYVRDNEIKYKIVDTTRLGVNNNLLPASLGLRPQAMKVKPVVSATPGAFILQSVPTRNVFEHAAMIIDLFNEKNRKKTYHQAFIGETVSRIYHPCYLKDNQLLDAVNNRVMGQSSILKDHLAQTCSSKVSWEPRFITTICPGCGGLLAGEPDSLVLQCKNCQSLWQEHKNRLISLKWKAVVAEEREAHYLPFWKITFSTNGYILKTFGDYLRFTNQPLVVREDYDKQPLVFWIPAFKIHPKAFLQLASQLTVAQGRIPSGKSMRLKNNYPVTLSRAEAHQAIKSVLAYSTVSKEKRFPLLPRLQVSETRCQLTYLPFIHQTHDLQQEHTFAVIQAAAIRFGRTL